MRALFDVNMLIACFDRAHIHHAVAMAWWRRNAAHGWASCPLTQNGYLRIVSQRGYARPVALPDAMAVLSRQIDEGGHAFWPDDLSILDRAAIDATRLLGPRQLTDVYLLALAVKHGGRLVTLDRGISHLAARAGEPRHLVSIL